MRLIHWLAPSHGVSGLQNMVYELFVNERKMGYDSHVCFTTRNTPTPFSFRGKPYSSSRWEVGYTNDAVNIYHNHIPVGVGIKYAPNRLAFMHGEPPFVFRDDEAREATVLKINQCQIILTAWPSHVKYWEAFGKPVFTVPPGVDLDYWTSEGPKKQFTGKPTILWADSWRDCSKEPYQALFRFKNEIKTTSLNAKLKLVNIPEDKRGQVEYFIDALGLQDYIEYPIEGTVSNIAEYYRGADILWSATGPDGNSVLWEAEACGLACNSYPPKRRDITDTIAAMVEIFEKEFDLRDA